MSEIGKYYNRIEDQGYDEIYNNPVCRAEDAVVMSYIAPHLSSKSRILDVGCGTGLVASLLKGNEKYQGVDVSINELSKANSKVSEYTGSFAQADMHSLPFEDKSFDVLVSSYGPFSYSLEPKALLKEFKRVLTPKGRFIIMPYTKRTGMSIGLGGFSTAVEPSIRKNFYTEKKAKEVFSEANNLQVFGINYLPNLMLDKIEKGLQQDRFDSQTVVSELNSVGELMNEKLNLDFSRNKFPELIPLYNVFLKNQGNIELNKRILEKEIKAFNGIVPAHFARHMVVTGQF